MILEKAGSKMSVRLVVGGSSDRSVSDSTPARAQSAIRSIAPTARSAAAASEAADISRGAGVLGQLSSLQSAQPSRFKAVSSEITSKLKAEADTHGGDVGKKLGELADKFAEAARTGDMSALRPAGRTSSMPARGADAYRQTAQRAPGGSDVEQLIADALKDMSKRSA